MSCESNGCPLCQHEEAMRQKVPANTDALTDGIGRLISGHFESEKALYEHLAFAAYLTLEGYLAKFGRDETIRLLETLTKFYSKSKDDRNGQWKAVEITETRVIH